MTAKPTPPNTAAAVEEIDRMATRLYELHSLWLGVARRWEDKHGPCYLMLGTADDLREAYNKAEAAANALRRVGEGDLR